MRSIENDELINTIPQLVRKAINRFGLLGSIARYLLMRDELKKFILSAEMGERSFRKQLVKDFMRIHKHVACAHSPYQFILMAEYLFNFDVPGPMIQCGCFKGGSTAQLSILAKKINRRLYVCDSFMGLPNPDFEDELRLTARNEKLNLSFAAGDYKGGLEEVKENVRRFGCLDVCEFVPGFFKESLPSLDVTPAFVFIDVDLVSSARDCLQYLWPRLMPDGYWFTHEAPFFYYIEGILNADWWHQNLKENQPIIWGGGTGLSELAPGIAYFKKSVR